MRLKFIMVIVAASLATFADSSDERLRALRKVCSFIPSDDLTEEEVEPTPDDVIRKYHVTTNDVLQDLKVIVGQNEATTTNFYAQVRRIGAVAWIGQYGGTNEMPLLTSILTNRLDCARDAALGASMNITMKAGGLTNLVEWVVSDTNTFNAAIRRTAYIWMYDTGVEALASTNNQGVAGLVRDFFLRRAGVERSDEVLFVDRAACEFYPSYRHSQQRRDNLAALRPPNLTGKPAELYDARQADAAEGE